MSTIRIDVCCNDPDNGLFDHRAAGIQTHDNLFELSAHDLRGPVFLELDQRLRLGRRAFSFRHAKYGYGNWCWNAYWLDLPIAGEFIAWAHAMGCFSMDQGEERMFARWKDRRRFDDRDREFFVRQMVKARLAEEARR